MANSTALDVRTWALANGHPAQPVGTKGRVPNGTIALFNEAHPKAKYAPGRAITKTVTVKAKPEKGRTVTKKVVVSEARKWALANGHTVGAKGTLPQSVLAEFVLANR